MGREPERGLHHSKRLAPLVAALVTTRLTLFGAWDYPPDAPQKAMIDGFWYLWGVPTVFGALGIICLPGGLVVLLRSQIVARSKRQPESV